MRIISVDFETEYDTKNGYGIKELGTWKYLHHERFNPYLISVCDGGESWAGETKDFNWDALQGAVLMSHNKYFDAMVQATMVERGMAPKLVVPAWHCTANMSAYLCNRRSLADAVEFLMSVKLDKGVRDRANGKAVADIKAEGWFDDMLRYARSDAFFCYQLFAKHGYKWPEHERRLSEMTIAQGTRGIQIHRQRLDSYIITAHEMLKRAESVLPWVGEGRPPTSPKAIAEHCRACGIPGPPVKSREGEDAFLDWENTYGLKHQWIANVSNWRSINKFLESLYTIKDRLMPGDVFSFSLKYAGAHTLRWSGDAGFNLQNMRKIPLYRDTNGFLITDVQRLQEIVNSENRGALPEYVTHSLDIRALFISRK